ncbi:MAG: hypothetical protein WBR29_07600 [Gammaproteobacteria bacterium]
MNNSIPMNVWPSRPVPVRPTDWAALARERTLAIVTYQALCDLAGVAVRISGADLDRRVHVLAGDQHAYPVGMPDTVGVALPGYRGTRVHALRILEILAYGFFDYAARETLRGRDLFAPSARPGRKASGKALSGAERMRRMRL